MFSLQSPSGMEKDRENEKQLGYSLFSPIPPSLNATFDELRTRQRWEMFHHVSGVNFKLNLNFTLMTGTKVIEKI